MKTIRIVLTILATLTGLALLLIFVVGPIVTRPRAELSELAAEWRDRGRYIAWESTLKANAGFGELSVFTIQEGDPANPAIVMVHGYPTSSFDFYELFALLSDEFFVVALDTPGYGLSDKPKDGFVYSLEDDAQLLEYYVGEVLGLDSFTMVTHDKGNSVGLTYLDLYPEQVAERMIHYVITNGNIYLPLAKLTVIQSALLNMRVGPFITRYVNGNMFALGMNDRMHSVTESEAKVTAIASIIDHDDGGEVQHATIQYLAQRAENELRWLDVLAASTVPTTLIWGEEDPVAPLQVADFVWEEYLRDRAAPTSYWRLSGASHYLQNDQPEVLAELIRMAIDGMEDGTESPSEATLVGTR